MQWPATYKEMRDAGFLWTLKSEWCACGKIIFWFTDMEGNWLPIEAVLAEEYVSGGQPHAEKCANPDHIKKLIAKKNRKSKLGRVPSQNLPF